MIMDMIRRSDVISAIEEAKAHSTFATDDDYIEMVNAVRRLPSALDDLIDKLREIEVDSFAWSETSDYFSGKAAAVTEIIVMIQEIKSDIKSY